MFTNNLKIAFRNLLRHRRFTVINVLGLGLGMASSIFAFLWVQNEYSFDSYHARAEHIYRINTDLKVSEDDIWYWATTPLPLQEAMKNEVPEIVRVASINENPWRPFTVRKDATTFRQKRYAYASEDWFGMFSHKFLDGRADGFQANLRSAILTQSFAEKIFGRHDVAGEPFKLDSMDFVVHGVIEDHPTNSSFNFEMLLPLSYYLSVPQNKENENWNNFNFVTFVETRPGTDLKALGEKITGILHKSRKQPDSDEEDGATLWLQPLTDTHFDEARAYSGGIAGSRSTTQTFAIIGFVILLLACVNYVSLTTAQAGMRSKEVGVRKIIGAGGDQIFRLLFGETVLTSLISLVLAMVLVALLLPTFNQFTEKNFQLDPSNPVIWAVAAGTLGVALLLSGVYPALFLTGFSPGNFLRGQNFLKMKNSAFRKGLVVLQFAVTTGLIIGAMVMFRQQEFIRKKDLGFDRSQVFEFTVPNSDRREAVVNGIQQALKGSTAVLATAASNSSLVEVQSTHSGSIEFEGKPADFVPTVSQLSVDPHVAELLKLDMAEGRWFQAGSEADLNNVLLNETAVKFLKLPLPVVGQSFEFHGNKGQVIGVVKDFHFQSMRSEITPMVLFNYPPSNANLMVKTSEGKVAEALAAAEQAWHSFYPDLPFEYQFMDEAFDRLYRAEQQSAALFQVLAGLAVFISCLGLFGLAVFSTQQRVKEIGVRKVLGASVPSLVGLLSKDFLILVVVSLVIASPLAWYFMDKWLQNFAYRIDIQWTVFALAGVVAVGVAFLTVSFQSVKAALANPVESLRNE
ncbi:MAG: ABC transporter permease [Saprospiraceae bacterium]|nr:ABC transporter permease [Saprospiraceae bacterium]